MNWDRLRYRCMVCGEQRVREDLRMTQRAVAGREHDFPHTSWTVRYCADSHECAQEATARGPWPGQRVLL